MILDTVAFVRLLREELSDEALLDLESADTLVVSGASFFEINQKIRIGKLDMRRLGETEIAALAERGVRVESVSTEVMAHAASMAWRHEGEDHRDPFDRMIAATALGLDVPVVTSDRAFQSLSDVGLKVRVL